MARITAAAMSSGAAGAALRFGWLDAADGFGATSREASASELSGSMGVTPSKDSKSAKPFGSRLGWAVAVVGEAAGSVPERSASNPAPLVAAVVHPITPDSMHVCAQRRNPLFCPHFRRCPRDGGDRLPNPNPKRNVRGEISPHRFHSETLAVFAMVISQGIRDWHATCLTASDGTRSWIHSSSRQPVA